MQKVNKKAKWTKEQKVNFAAGFLSSVLGEVFGDDTTWKSTLIESAISSIQECPVFKEVETLKTVDNKKVIDLSTAEYKAPGYEATLKTKDKIP